MRRFRNFCGCDQVARCGLIAWLAVIWLVAGQRSAVAAAEDTLHFLALGDMGSGTQTQRDVAEAMAKYAVENKTRRPVNFVLVLGDNFYERGVESAIDPQWSDKFEKMYDPKRLPMPFVAVLGNHDWRGDLPDVQIDYHKRHAGTRWEMDGHWFKRHYAMGGKSDAEKAGADFFCIDSTAFFPGDSHVAKYHNKDLSEKQLAWLRTELQESKALWKFVVAHHPLYSNGLHGHDGAVLELRSKLVPLLTKYKVDGYISGHDHDLQRIENHETPTLFLISGAGGKLREKKYEEWKPFYAAKPGFASVRLTAREMRGQFIDSQGKVLDDWHRAPLAAKGSPEPSP